MLIEGINGEDFENMKKCAVCGISITDEYLIVGDNYLQAKYFDSVEDNIFCSKECLCNGLSVLRMEVQLE